MKERYMQLPEILRRKAVFRLAGGIAALFLFVAVQISYGDISFSLPCLLLGSLELINGSHFLYSGLKGNYLCIRGTCRQIETAGFQKRMKSICMDTEMGRLKISVYRTIRNLVQGDVVSLYLAEKTPIYEQDGRYVVCSYFALTKEDRKGSAI